MICYAIKNKKEEHFLEIGEYCAWTPHINRATLFNDYELTLCFCTSDCKVVKVEIREVEE